MLAKLLVIVAVVAVAESADCKPPSTAFKAESCLNNPIIKVDLSSVKMTPYPPTAHSPITLAFDIDNTGPTVDKTVWDATVEFYGEVAFKCGWHKLPISLNNQDGCKENPQNCPIKPGKKHLTSHIDLTPYASIIDKLGANTYYRLSITTKNAADKKPLNCVKASMLLAKGF